MQRLPFFIKIQALKIIDTHGNQVSIVESVLNVAFLGHNCCTIHGGIAVCLLLDHRLLAVSVLLQSKLVL